MPTANRQSTVVLRSPINSVIARVSTYHSACNIPPSPSTYVSAVFLGDSIGRDSNPHSLNTPKLLSVRVSYLYILFWRRPSLLKNITAMAAADDEITYTLPSLLELAYHACNRDQRKRYDELPVASVDLQVCCESILQIIKLNSCADLFQPRGHRRFMFAKVHHDYRLINNICERASFHGHINCMKLARAIGVPWYTPDVWQRSACDEAADTGNMECLVYAHVNGSPWSTWTCNFAAGSGSLDCLKYCRENGFPWDEFTCTNAARNGRLECLVYARQNGCPWDADTCSMAALNGQLDCLKYCRENSCPWDTFTCEMAACTGKLDCLRYAIENGCDWDIDGYLTAFHGMKDPYCLRYALELKHGLSNTNATTSSPDDVIPSK